MTQSHFPPTSSQGSQPSQQSSPNPREAPSMAGVDFTFSSRRSEKRHTIRALGAEIYVYFRWLRQGSRGTGLRATLLARVEQHRIPVNQQGREMRHQPTQEIDRGEEQRPPEKRRHNCMLSSDHRASVRPISSQGLAPNLFLDGRQSPWSLYNSSESVPCPHITNNISFELRVKLCLRLV